MKNWKNIALIVSIIFNVLMVIYAEYKNADAERWREVAEASKTEAEAQRKIAEEMKSQAENALIEAQKQRALADKKIKTQQ